MHVLGSSSMAQVTRSRLLHLQLEEIRLRAHRQALSGPQDISKLHDPLQLPGPRHRGMHLLLRAVPDGQAGVLLPHGELQLHQ